MNVRLYDGTVRCAQHMDASSYASETSDPCLYHPTDVSLDKIDDVGAEAEAIHIRRPNLRPFYPLYSHRNGLRANSLEALASALWILALEGGTAHLTPIPGTKDPEGNIVPARF